MQLKKRKVPENENPDKLIDIAEEIVNFNKHQEGSGLKILAPKKCFKDYQ